MQTEPAVLIPPSEEQAWPSFHVRADLASAFLNHLKANRIEVQLPPEDIGHPAPGNDHVVEIEVAEEHSQPQLEGILNDFLQRNPAAHQ